MKTTLFITAATSLLLVGCGETSNPAAQTTNAATGGSPLTAPVDYLSAVAKAQQSAVKTVDEASLNQVIQVFNVDKGRFPKDLNELVAENYIPKLPKPPYGTKLTYDANTGKVKVVKL
jgi:hypothetical protein